MRQWRAGLESSFVHIRPFFVDYLTPDQTRRLVTEPVPQLHYPPEISAQIHQLTQGHPDLVQRICHGIVKQANAERLEQVAQTQLDRSVESYLNEKTSAPAPSLFWKGFCKEPDRATLRNILNGEAPGNPKSLARLRH